MERVIYERFNWCVNVKEFKNGIELKTQPFESKIARKNFHLNFKLRTQEEKLRLSFELTKSIPNYKYAAEFEIGSSKYKETFEYEDNGELEPNWLTLESTGIDFDDLEDEIVKEKLWIKVKFIAYPKLAEKIIPMQLEFKDFDQNLLTTNVECLGNNSITFISEALKNYDTFYEYTKNNAPIKLDISALAMQQIQRFFTSGSIGAIEDLGVATDILKFEAKFPNTQLKSQVEIAINSAMKVQDAADVIVVAREFELVTLESIALAQMLWDFKSIKNLLNPDMVLEICERIYDMNSASYFSSYVEADDCGDGNDEEESDEEIDPAIFKRHPISSSTFIKCSNQPAFK